MSIARKDNKVNGDLVDEISDSFNRAMAKRSEPAGETDDEGVEPQRPRFVVTGDQRHQERPSTRE